MSYTVCLYKVAEVLQRTGKVRNTPLLRNIVGGPGNHAVEEKRFEEVPNVIYAYNAGSINVKV
jgi:hypothetical protein